MTVCEASWTQTGGRISVRNPKFTLSRVTRSALIYFGATYRHLRAASGRIATLDAQLWHLLLRMLRQRESRVSVRYQAGSGRTGKRSPTGHAKIDIPVVAPARYLGLRATLLTFTFGTIARLCACSASHTCRTMLTTEFRSSADRSRIASAIATSCSSV